MTAYFEAGTIVGATSDDSRWVFADLIDQDEAGGLPVPGGRLLLDPHPDRRPANHRRGV